MSSEILCPKNLKILISWIKSNFQKLLILVADKVVLGTQGYSRTACMFLDDPSNHHGANRLASLRPSFLVLLKNINVFLNLYFMRLIGSRMDKKDGNRLSLHFYYC